MKGAETWMPQKENNAEQREFILKQTRSSMNNDNAIAWKYIDLRSSAVQQFQKMNSYLKMAK
jgi:hypothetical protein